MCLGYARRDSARQAWRHYLKIDVEGSEWDVLFGGEKYLTGANVPPVIQIEFNPVTAERAGYSATEMLIWLKEKCGYEFYRNTVTGRLVKIRSLRELDAAVRDVFCFVPAVHAGRLIRARAIVG